jgi:3-oxoacyl-[acyl-carrier protein] reductase
MELEDQVAIVTGGARGIGEATAKVLAREGANIVLSDLRIKEANNLAQDIRTMGRKALVIKTDVSVEGDVNNMVKVAFEEFKKIDILVNNAGILRFGLIEEIPVGEWDEVLAIHLRGTFLCSKAVIPIMKKQRSGKIVSLSSCASKIGGNHGAASYNCAKAGISCFTIALARQLAPYNIRANAVAPGLVDTPMTSEDYELGSYKSEWKKNFIKATPLGLGKPEDIAEAILFLVSDKRSRWITGEILDVNGGVWMD